MKIGVVFASIAGVTAAMYIAWTIGFHAIFGSISRAGFGGLGVLCAYALIVLAVLSAAWMSLLPRNLRTRPHKFYLARLVRDSIAEISPFSPLGGMVASGRLMVLSGMNANYAAASVAVDVTTEAMALAAFLTLGFALGMPHFRNLTGVGPLIQVMEGTLLLAVPCIAGFIVLQKGSADWAQRIVGRLFSKTGQEATFGQAIHGLYGSWLRLASSAALHLLGWMLAGGGTFIAFHLVGGYISIPDALALEAFLCMLRSLAVFVPAAIGVQEAGYAMLAPIFGLPAEMGLAVSLLKRTREIAIGIPALIYWQIMEGRKTSIGSYG